MLNKDVNREGPKIKACSKYELSTQKIGIFNALQCFEVQKCLTYFKAFKH